MVRRIYAWMVGTLLTIIATSAVAQTCKKPKFTEDPWGNTEPCRKPRKVTTVRAPEIVLRTTPTPAPAITIPTITRSLNGKSVLFIGDSLGEGLAPQLKPYFEQRGYVFQAIVKNSQRIESFSEGRMSGEFYEALKSRPSIVLISLGANDELAGDYYGPTAQKAYNIVMSSIANAGAIAYWISPPRITHVKQFDKDGNYKGTAYTSGKIFPIIARSPRYFNSTVLEIPRQKDEFHPNRYGEWATAIKQWLGPQIA